MVYYILSFFGLLVMSYYWNKHRVKRIAEERAMPTPALVASAIGFAFLGVTIIVPLFIIFFSATMAVFKLDNTE